MFKNMKIEINEHQPLDAVVAEFERLGYVGIDTDVNYTPTMVIAFADGEYHVYYGFSDKLTEYKTTTLAELKEI